MVVHQAFKSIIPFEGAEDVMPRAIRNAIPELQKTLFCHILKIIQKVCVVLSS